MKKMLALLLSIIMAVSLAAPAFAAPGDGEPAASISGPVDSGILDDIQDDDFDWWTAEKEYLDAHPGLEEQLKASAYDYFAREYSEFGSPEEYMELEELTEEEFLKEMVLCQVQDLMAAEELQAQVDALKEALGGVPGQTGVMINGRYIQFPDAVPEVVKGRTMVPVRALVETLGGEVEYQSGAVEFVLGSYTYEFAIGRTTVTVTPVQDSGGDAFHRDTIKMDCAPYLKNNRTYVPIRFISEALGYEVGWDGTFQTAVLLDKTALAAEIDKDFTIINKVQASRGLALGEGESSLTESQCSLKATLFDTLNGSKTYTADMSGSTLMNTQAVNGTYSFTLSDNVLEALTELMVQSGVDAEEAAMVSAVISGMKEMEVIMTAEGKIWAHAPILDELYGQENVWAAMDLGPELGALFALQMDASSMTIGTVAASTVDANSVMSYITTMSGMVGMMNTLYGDEQFVTADGVSTLTIGLDDLAAMDPDSAQAVQDAFKEYQITMKVDEKGGVTASCVMETAAQEGVPAMKITIDAVQSTGKADVTMTLHVANLGEVELTASSTESVSTDAPNTQPPEGSVIIDTDIPAPMPE